MMRILVAGFLACLVGAAPAHSAPRRADSPEQPSDPNEKVVCKTFTRVGSLVDRYRTCKTKGEWQRERDNLRQVNISDSCATRGAVGGSVNPVPGAGNTFDC